MGAFLQLDRDFQMQGLAESVGRFQLLQQRTRKSGLQCFVTDIVWICRDKASVLQLLAVGLEHLANDP